MVCLQSTFQVSTRIGETNSSVHGTKIRFDAGINSGGFLLVLNQRRVINTFIAKLLEIPVKVF